MAFMQQQKHWENQREILSAIIKNMKRKSYYKYRKLQ